nr:MAG TPA: hypothetical protein [Caudoviricetes sp.]
MTIGVRSTNASSREIHHTRLNLPTLLLTYVWR